MCKTQCPIMDASLTCNQHPGSPLFLDSEFRTKICIWHATKHNPRVVVESTWRLTDKKCDASRSLHHYREKPFILNNQAIMNTTKSYREISYVSKLCPHNVVSNTAWATGVQALRLESDWIILLHLICLLTNETQKIWTHVILPPL